MYFLSPIILSPVPPHLCPSKVVKLWREKDRKNVCFEYSYQHLVSVVVSLAYVGWEGVGAGAGAG